jgi:hypothetical protein
MLPEHATADHCKSREDDDVNDFEAQPLLEV